MTHNKGNSSNPKRGKKELADIYVINIIVCWKMVIHWISLLNVISLDFNITFDDRM